MAATLVTPTTWQASGQIRVGIGVVNLGVYATGGVAIDPTLFGITTIYMVSFDGSTNGFSYSFDYTNKRILAWVQGMVIAAAGAAVIDDFSFAGNTGATAGRSIGLDAAAASPIRFGVLQEVANAFDFSSNIYNFRMKIEGI